MKIFPIVSLRQSVWPVTVCVCVGVCAYKWDKGDQDNLYN